MDFIWDSITQSFGLYYGADWAALVLGLCGMALITEQRRMGFMLSGAGCICGLYVALISGQFGFVVYNLALMSMMARGFYAWRQPLQNASANSMPRRQQQP